jgi:YD repeat-containing protein
MADPTAITGGYSYGLGQGSIIMSGLSAATTYVVSYWSNTGSSYSVTGSMGFTQGKTIAINGGSWTYFEHTVTGTPTVSVSSASGTGNIDELRLYPQGSQMTTYTYSPLMGMTSQCDVDSRVTYYTYDALGRLRYIRDQDGNIIKTYQYHYQGQ